MSEYNEQGFKFETDIELTKYIHKDDIQWGAPLPHVLKGVPKNLIVLKVIHKENGHISNLLFNTTTQTAEMEIPLGEPGWTKLSFIKVHYNFNNEKIS